MIKIIKALYWFFYFLFHPSFWFSDTRTSKIWDKKLNQRIEKGKLIEIKKHTCTIDSYVIWISNYPYAFGSCYNKVDLGLPTKKTSVKLASFLSYNMDKIYGEEE